MLSHEDMENMGNVIEFPVVEILLNLKKTSQEKLFPLRKLGSEPLPLIVLV